MATKKSAQFKRFASAMSKIVTVSKDELAKREAAYKRERAISKERPTQAPQNKRSGSCVNSPGPGHWETNNEAKDASSTGFGQRRSPCL